jgi:hypothetical protein
MKEYFIKKLNLARNLSRKPSDENIIQILLNNYSEIVKHTLLAAKLQTATETIAMLGKLYRMEAIKNSSDKRNEGANSKSYETDKKSEVKRPAAVSAISTTGNTPSAVRGGGAAKAPRLPQQQQRQPQQQNRGDYGRNYRGFTQRGRGNSYFRGGRVRPNYPRPYNYGMPIYSPLTFVPPMYMNMTQPQMLPMFQNFGYDQQKGFLTSPPAVGSSSLAKEGGEQKQQLGN